jgi:hypothetical protein
MGMRRIVLASPTTAGCRKQKSAKTVFFVLLPDAGNDFLLTRIIQLQGDRNDRVKLSFFVRFHKHLRRVFLNYTTNPRKKAFPLETVF